jgi:hypothetical protein
LSIRSLQSGTWQIPCVQTLLWQSEATRHDWPDEQAEQEPPQSVSPSRPFWTPSEQVGG